MKKNITEAQLIDSCIGFSNFGNCISEIGDKRVSWKYGTKDDSPYFSKQQHIGSAWICINDSEFIPAWPPAPERAAFFAANPEFLRGE